ncbi:hypothetical protein ARMGADRAFT_1033421 [Armillaria gallica]|uniref:Uncharacterized protein n=1 Tax=Armillaria gallica TaxID=47427 RepID=A0A2H3DPK1_ARMGA|nr:hypothetical protein ARMGADRAFT_1033421 [Armillaria gallica]
MMVAHLKFPEEDAYIVVELYPEFIMGQQENSIAHTILKCTSLFNERYLPPSELSAEERKEFLMVRAAVKEPLLNLLFLEKLTLQPPGNTPESRSQEQQASQKKGSIRLKTGRGLTTAELYFQENHKEDWFVAAVEAKKQKATAMETAPAGTSSNTAGGDMDRVAKLKAARQDLQLGRKVAKQLLANKSDETQERMESLAHDDSQAKKYRPEKGSLEAILQNIDMLEAMTSQLVDIATEAGWVGSIQLTGMCPGEFNPRTYFMNFGENEANTFALQYPKYEDHVQTPFLEFVCSSFSSKKCEEFRKLMAMTKKPHQKRPRQHDDSDEEDFTKDVNAVGRASDEDTGRPSELTKRSKKKAKKDKCKQKEIGDNPDLGQKKPSRKKTKKTMETAVTSSSRTVHLATSSTAEPMALVTADMAAATPSTSEPAAPVTADTAATASASHTADPVTNSMPDPMTPLTASNTASSTAEPMAPITTPTASVSRTADPATSSMPNPMALLMVSNTARSSPSISVSQPITTSSASELSMASNPVINTNDFDMTELGDAFQNFMDMEWESWDGQMLCASTDADLGQLDMSHMNSSMFLPPHTDELQAGLSVDRLLPLLHNTMMPNFGDATYGMNAQQWNTDPSNVNMMSQVNSAHLALNQGQQTYMWQQLSISVWQPNWSYSTPSQNITNGHSFPSNSTSVNFPSQVPPTNYNAFAATNITRAEMNRPVPAENSANFNAFDLTNTPAIFPNQVMPTKMNMRAPSANFNTFAVTHTPENLPNQVAPAEMNMPVPAKHARNHNAGAATDTPINPLNPPSMLAAEMEGNTAKSLMNDVENVIADPSCANDNPELPLASHSQDDIQAPRKMFNPCENTECKPIRKFCRKWKKQNHWKEFEMSMTVKEGQLATTGRPVALTELLKKKTCAMLPTLSPKDQMDLIHETLEWWMSLQSPERDLNMCLPLPNYTGNMHQIRKKGWSRMVLVMFLVRWWGTIVLESKMAP